MPDVTRTAVPDEFRPQPEAATARQKDFLLSLLSEREMPEKDGMTGAERADACRKMLEAGRLSKKQASSSIEYLLRSCPKKDVNVSGRTADLPDVPAGRYAVPGDDGELKFYHVDRPGSGQWAGWTFLKIRAGDELHPIKGMPTVRVILEKIITAGPDKAAIQYGQSIRQCCACGRGLTRRISRAMGIGPICNERLGWFPEVDANALRAQMVRDGLDPDEDLSNDETGE